MNDEQRQKLETIFRIVFELDDGADVTSLRQVTNRNWDSLATVSLNAAVESEFSVSIDAADMERMTSFEAVRFLIEEKLG